MNEDKLISEWRISVHEKTIHIYRWHGDSQVPREVYRPVDRATGAVWMSAISQGLQPPRDIRQCSE